MDYRQTLRDLQRDGWPPEFAAAAGADGRRLVGSPELEVADVITLRDMAYLHQVRADRIAS